MCQRAAKSAGLKPYRVTVVHQLQEPDKDKKFENAGLLSMGSLKRQGLRHTSPDIGRSEAQHHAGDSSY